MVVLEVLEIWKPFFVGVFEGLNIQYLQNLLIKEMIIICLSG